MRTVNVKKIRGAVKRLCVTSNLRLRQDVLAAIKTAEKNETNKKAKRILGILIENAGIAARDRMPICQDTGFPSVYIKIGQDVRLIGGDLNKAINSGVRDGYKEGFFRESIVRDPITRGVPGTIPANIHVEITKGDKVKINVSPKGFGSENKNKTAMLKPTAAPSEITDFVVDTVKEAGPDACPPYIVGVGIGGTFDLAAFLSKKALFRSILTRNPDPKIAAVEKEILKKVNHLNIGPMGLGGRTTCLGVNIEVFPTHIAGLPIGVNISCHATRSASETI